jgi:peptide/nickel transport system substrate-binding protein
MSGGTAGLALAACAPIQPPAPTSAPAAKPTDAPKPAAAAPTAASAAPKPTAPAPAAGGAPSGGTLRILQVTDVQPKNVHTLYFPNYAWLLQVGETLIRKDWRAGLKDTPALAESWEFSPDYLTLTFKLRKGVKFHTGRELGAEDVKGNLLRVREEKVGSQWRGYSLDIGEIETPDPSTVVLRFKEPRPGIFDMFEALVMLDPQTFDGLETGAQVVGTGPFTWVRWTPNDQLVLARNPDYWRSGSPLLDEITIRVVPDPQALSVNLESGGADLVVSPAYAEIPRLKGNPALTVLSSEAGSENFYLGADVLQPPLDDQKVRQAINWAIDGKRIVDSVLQGVGRAKSIPWGPSNPAWDDAQANAYSFDLDRAKALLAEAGQGGGFDVTLSTNTALEPLRGMAQVIQSDLAKLGVRVRIQEMEASGWLDHLVGRKFRGLWLGPTGAGNFHLGSVVTLLFPFRPANASNYQSDRYAELAQRARVETDPARAKAVYRDLTQLLLDESFVMPITMQRTTWAMSQRVKGFDYTALEVQLLAGVGVEK